MVFGYRMLVSSAAYAPGRRHPLKHVITHGAWRPIVSPGSEMPPSFSKTSDFSCSRRNQVETTGTPVICS